MAMAEPGETARIAAEGGSDLLLQIATLCAGHPVARVLYALILELGVVLVLAADDLAEAEELAAEIGADVAAIARKNWHRHAEVRAQAEAFGAKIGEVQ
jgi:hypothetical protein